MHLCRNISARLPGLEPFIACQHRVIYGPRYRRARQQAFARSRGICQCCGRRRATQAHYWAQRYPPDDKITAADLTAVCGPCHWLVTFRRLLDRAASVAPVAAGALPAATRAAAAPRSGRRPRARRRTARTRICDRWCSGVGTTLAGVGMNCWLESAVAWSAGSGSKRRRLEPAQVALVFQIRKRPSLAEDYCASRRLCSYTRGTLARPLESR